MAAELEKLIVSLQADLKQYEREMARANKVTVTQLRAIERQAQASATHIQRAMTRVGSSIRAGIAGALTGLSVGGAVAKLDQIIKKFAEIKDEADRAGVSAEFLQKINVAGLSEGAKGLPDLIQKFNLEIGEAVSKGGDLANLLKANGVALRDANGEVRTTAELFFEVADLIKRAGSFQEAMLVAQLAFGKTSKDNIAFLRQGGDEIQRGMELAEKTGAVLSEEGVNKADEFADRWALAWATFDAESATALNALVEWGDSFDEAFKRTAFYQLFSRGGIIDRALSITPSVSPPMATRGGPGPLQSSNIGAKGDRTIIPNKEDIEAAEDLAEAIDKVKKSLEFERQQLVATSLQQKINTALRDAGTTAATKEGQEIIALVTSIEALTNAQTRAAVEAENFVNAQREAAEQAEAEAKRMEEAFESAFSSLVESAGDGTLKLKELLSVLNSLRDQLLRMAAEKIFQMVLGALIGPAGGAPSTIGLVPGMAGRQSGGHVNRGDPYTVGERGPEIFVPSQSGTVVPNGGGGGGRSGYGKVVINNYGAAIEQSSRSGVSGMKDLIVTVKAITRSEFPGLLNEHATIIGGRPISRRTV